MRICLDFDGVVHDPYNVEPGYKMGQPVHGARENIKRLRSTGHTVYICTARPDVRHVVEWLRYFEINVDLVTHEKPLADVYIDDRGMRFHSWPELRPYLDAAIIDHELNVITNARTKKRPPTR